MITKGAESHNDKLKNDGSHQHLDEVKHGFSQSFWRTHGSVNPVILA